MPNWSPIWSDVVFDHAAAQAFADACRRTAQELDRIRATRDSLAQATVIDWEGRHRERFDRDIQRWARQAEDTAMRLLASANGVETRAGEAHREQARREADRRRWDAEVRAERQAAEVAEQHRLAQQQLDARQAQDPGSGQAA